MHDVFYLDGLHFSCTQCSTCCRYDPGIVLLTEDDLSRLCARLSLGRNRFISLYCKEVPTAGGTWISLSEKPDNDCVFWDSGCTVYEDRPLQCKSYPFWRQLVSSEEDWNAEKRHCPGIGKGALHTREEIEEWIRLRLANAPLTVETGRRDCIE